MGRMPSIRGKSKDASENSEPTRKVILEKMDKGDSKKKCTVHPGAKVVEVGGEKVCAKVYRKRDRDGEWVVDKDWEGNGIPKQAKVETRGFSQE